MDQYSHRPIGEPTDDATAHRTDARDSLFLMADLAVVGLRRVEQVRVRNLSAGGLMAEYPRGMEQGTAVLLELRGIGEVPGRVAWSAAGRIGIAFDTAIDPLLARKPVKPAVPAKPTKAIFTQ